MEITEKYGLILDGEDDYYDIKKFNANFRSLESSVLGSGVSAVQTLTEQDYSELTVKKSDTLYIVLSGVDIMIYLGDIPLKSNGAANTHGTITLNNVGSTAIAGIAETEE